MKKLLFYSLCLLGMTAIAQVKPGDNLLVNGKFDADQEDFPPFWANQASRYLSYNPSGGPNGLPSVKLASAEPSNTESTFRQYDLELVPGETYRISAWVRTKDFKSRHYGFTVCNNGWFSEQGIKEFKPTQDWTLMTNEFKAEKSNNGKYMMIFFAVNFQGEAEIADVKLEAVSKGALENSRPPQISTLLQSPKLIPVAPLLNQIPLDKPELTFRYFGKLPGGTFDDYWFILYFDDNAALRQQLQRGMNTAKLPPKAGKHHISVEILPKNAPLPIWKEEFDITIVNIPKVSAAGHRRLNNLVTEILNAELAKDAAEQTFTVSHVRNGWVYFAVKDAQNAPVEVFVDGKQIIGKDSLANEAFRELPAGELKATVKGAANGGRLVVRSIVDIFNYCPGANSYVGENGKYDWSLLYKYVLPAVTTLNGGSIPEANRPWLRRNGYHWLANANTTQIAKGQDLVDILKKNGGFIAPHYDGATCDEQFFSRLSTLQYYTDGVKQFEKENPSDRLIYTWIVGKPAVNAVSFDFISTSVNASKSRGKLLFEIYCRTKETEQQAAAYLREYAVETIENMKAIYPGVESSTGIIFGNFNQIPILSLAHHPAVDFKYYLDMQLNLVANDPAFANLGATGYWGSYYADRELYRWAFMLLRHYCVEGNTEMLSKQYGFSYTPNHLQNGDFSGKLDPWTAGGDVRADKSNGFASTSQNRWGGNNGVGDTFAVFKKTADETSTLTQTVRNLIPGQMYCLQFATGDYKDIVAKRHNPRKYGIEANLGDGAVIDAAQSWLHIDKRQKGRYAHNNNVARINLHHIVFKATKPETTLVFSNAAALPGEELVLNYVMLNPYLPGE